MSWIGKCDCCLLLDIDSNACVLGDKSYGWCWRCSSELCQKHWNESVILYGLADTSSQIGTPNCVNCESSIPNYKIEKKVYTIFDVEFDHPLTEEEIEKVDLVMRFFP